jgi:glycosyltransferase involved in cell wall biosynthesis
MRIGIDIRAIAAAGLGRGLATYTTNLVKSLLTLDQENHFCLFIAKDQSVPGFLQQLPSPDHVTIVRLQRPTRNIFLWDQLFWYALLKKEHIDVFHSTMYGVPLFCPCPKVLTIHDLTPLIFPEFITNFRHKIVFRFNFFTSKYADRIITPSQHSKRDLMRYLNVPEKSISVTLEGVTEQYKILPNREDIAQVKAHYHIPGKYLLYVGGFDKNKNLVTLVKAFHRLLQKSILKEDLFLVFVGTLTQDALSLREFVKTCKLENRVIFTDFVPEEKLIKLYNGAEIFVFPSLYEGFGLPPLEAMACGVPVITSHAASLPEIVGDAGIQIDPHAPEELCHAIIEVFTNQELRKDLQRKGIERASLLSWEETARKTLRVYQEVLNYTSSPSF